MKTSKEVRRFYLMVLVVSVCSLIIFAAILAMAQCDPRDLTCISMP